jgi:hypothetical protein
MNEQLIGDLFAESQRQMTGSSSREFSEKFAELIVRECMKLNSKELSITAIERLLPLYQEHFGVEDV